MKYMLLIYGNPDTRAVFSGEEGKEFGKEMDALMAEITESGELVGGEALGDAAAARLFRWRDGHAFDTDGPYSETREHLAGFFLIDVADQARAEYVAAKFAGPGETVELRPVMWPGGDDQ